MNPSNPLDPIDVAQEVKKIQTGEELETLVNQLFQRLGWTTDLTPRSGDYGADVIATAPYGTSYAIQCKHHFNSEAENLTDIQEVVSSLPIYQAQQAIVVTTGSGYRDSAITLAQANRVWLWGFRELQLLAEAPGWEGALERLHLIPPPIPIPEPTKPPRRFALWPALLAGLMVLGLSLGLGMRFLEVQQNRQVLEVVKQFDQVILTALKTNQTHDLPTYLQGEYLEQRLNLIAQRQAKNCHIETTPIEPTTFRVDSRKSTQAQVTVRRHWEQQQFCDGQVVQVQGLAIKGDPYEITFTLSLLNGDWFITSASEARPVNL